MRQPHSLTPLPFVLIAALAGCGGGGDPPAPTGTAQLSFAERCTQLVGKAVSPGTIMSTALNAETSTRPQTCEAMGRIETSPTSVINFRIDLPEDASWNTKLLQMGGGGYNGNIPPIDNIDAFTDGVPVRKRGYVFAASDSGHQGPSRDFNFALNNPEALDNFAFNAHPQLLQAALATIQTVYGTAPTRKYFFGISTGGREALQQAQRFAGSYDGIVAGMPVVDYSIVNQKGIAIGQAAFGNGGAGWLNPVKVKLFETAQLAACDVLDGVIDGIIANVAGCSYNPQLLQCPGGVDTGDTCLSDAQIATVNVMRTRTPLPTAVANGITTAAPLGIGDEASPGGWTTMQLGASATVPASAEFSFAEGYLKYGVTSNPAFDLFSYVPGTFAAEWLALSNKVNATDPDLNAFADRGAKLLLWHGASDHLVPPGYSSDYYSSVVARLGQTKTDSFMRFYLMPGVGHAPVGSGANRSDLMAALENWVERSQAPDSLIGTKFAGDGVTPALTRPICRYPTFPRYNGTGNVNLASSFTCSFV